MTDPANSPPDGNPEASAGWYPDPLLVAEFRFWNGHRWTHQVTGGGSRGGGAPGNRLDKGEWLIVAGGVALAVSPFLPWTRIALVGDLSLFEILDLEGRDNVLAWLAVIVGASVAAYAGFIRTNARIVGVMAGLCCGLYALLTALNLAADVRETSGIASMGYGAWIAVLGCGAMTVGGLLRPGHPAPQGVANDPP